MASHFRTKQGIVLVNIEFDVFLKKVAVLLWVGQRRFALVNCALVQGPRAGGLPGSCRRELAGSLAAPVASAVLEKRLSARSASSYFGYSVAVLGPRTDLRSRWGAAAQGCQRDPPGHQPVCTSSWDSSPLILDLGPQVPTLLV